MSEIIVGVMLTIYTGFFLFTSWMVYVYLQEKLNWKIRNESLSVLEVVQDNFFKSRIEFIIDRRLTDLGIHPAVKKKRRRKNE